MTSNPLLRSLNEPIDFSAITASHIPEAVSETLSSADKRVQNLLDTTSFTFESTLKELDSVYHGVFRVYNPIYLLAETHPEEPVRNASRAAIEQFSTWLNELAVNEELYQVIKNYQSTPEAIQLTGAEQRYLTDTLSAFRRAGFELSKEKREELKNLRIELDSLSLQFQKNIAASTGDSIEIKADETDGLPIDFIETRKTATGTVKIDLSMPSYLPFMKYSTRTERRKELWLKYNQRAWPKNLEILDRILEKRHQLATMLGYKTYADYALEDRMAGNTETVWKFEKDLAETVRKKAETDYHLLLEEKTAWIESPATTVDDWESAFLSNRIKESKYAVNDQEVRQYFELNAVLDGLFRINGTILGLNFREIQSPKVWHSDVRQFEVSDSETGDVTGTFYLDLFPRENKYSHAAMFPLVSGCQTNGSFERPVAALVCNFTRPSDDMPSLLLFSEVNTLFHEFGHLLHGMVSKSGLQAYAGTNVLLDFVETPSQFFENFLWDFETISSFARHYRSGEPIPESLFEKMKNARNLGSGLFAQAQIFYGMLDFTLHDQFTPGLKETTTDVMKRLKNELTRFPWVEGNYFHASFGHLSGYAAGYYSYLWAKVYAQDIWSVFEKEGALNPATGRRLRELILEPGGNVDPLELVESFLGRKPDYTAFLRDLGVN